MTYWGKFVSFYEILQMKIITRKDFKKILNYNAT